MIYLLRDLDTLTVAADRVEPSDFGDAAFVYGILWDIARSFYKEYSSTIPIDILIVQFENYVISRNMTFMPEQLQFITDFLQETYTYSNIVPGYGRALIQRLLEDARVIPLLRNIPENLDKFRNRLDKAYSQSRISVLKEVNVFNHEQNSDITDLPEMSQCGINFVDSVLGGGFRNRCLYGLLGWSGQFKTTLAIQIASLLSIQERHVIYFTFEQTARGMMARKAYASLCEVPTAVVTKENLESKSISNYDRIEKAKPYLHFYDVTDPSISAVLSSMNDVIRQDIVAGKKPALIIIDWLGQMVLMNIDEDGDKLYQQIFNHLQYLLHMAINYDTAILCIQQLAPATQKGPLHKPSMYDAQGCRAFSVLCNTVMALGTIDKISGCQYFISAKIRDSAYVEEIIKYDSRVSRLQCVTDAFRPNTGGLRGRGAFVEKNR